MKTSFSSKIIVLLLVSLMGVQCSKDTDGPITDLENPDQVPDPVPGDTRIVSGNPALNTFLITSNDESMYTVDAQTGQEQIIYTFPDLTDIEGLPEYDNGRIVVATDDNAVNAIDPNGNALVWDTPILEYDFNSLGVTEPVCVDGVCYAVGGTGVVVAMDEDSGTIKWYYTVNLEGELDDVLSEASTPIVYGDKVYIFSDEGFISDLLPYLHILDKETGSLLQRVTLPYEITGTPVLEDDILYLPAKNLYAIDVNTLEILWQFDAEAMGTPFFASGRIVFQASPPNDSISSRLYCLDAATGGLQWQIDTGADFLWSPLIIENVVFGIYDRPSGFVFDRSGRPFAVTLSDGEQLWYRDNVSVDHSPVYANGRLFFHGHDIDGNGDVDDNVGLMGMDANTGAVLWLNNSFRYQRSLPPLAIAQNGVFGPSYYRGN